MLYRIKHVSTKELVYPSQLKTEPNNAYVNINHIVKIEEKYVSYRERVAYYIVYLTDNSCYSITTEEFQNITHTLRYEI